MEKYKYTSWSKAARRSILSSARNEYDRNLAEAALLNEGLRRKPPEGWDSVKVIKDWRRKSWSSMPASL
ncbi:hypothetical protein J7L06_01830 [Candidatus Bathyarchaeota archaeon]|nr:hypothetical protein [Candidatus Bathyarchaeota archaeon]